MVRGGGREGRLLSVWMGQGKRIRRCAMGYIAYIARYYERHSTAGAAFVPSHTCETNGISAGMRERRWRQKIYPTALDNQIKRGLQCSSRIFYRRVGHPAALRYNVLSKAIKLKLMMRLRSPISPIHSQVHTILLSPTLSLHARRTSIRDACRLRRLHAQLKE